MSADEPRDDVMQRALATASRPAADPAFRARLRERFLDLHDVGEPDGDPAEAPFGAPFRESSGAPAPRKVRERTNVFPLVWPFVLAASVAAVIFFVLSRDAIVKWRVLDLPAGGQYVVDGYAVDAKDAARLADLLQTAHAIETSEQGLRFQLLDQVVIDLGPNTKVSQMTFPAAGAFSIRADSGSLRIGTGPGFEGSRMRVLTGDMEATVTGTVLSVDVFPTGTCLCCLHGTVRCDARDGSGAHPVEDGKRGFAWRTGKPPEWGQAVEPHLGPMRDLQHAIEMHGWVR